MRARGTGEVLGVARHAARPLSLRDALSAAMGVLVTLLLGTAIALAAVTSYLHATAEHLGSALEGVRVAQELELGLMMHDRMSTFMLATGSPYLPGRTAIEAVIRRRALEAHEHVRGADERDSLDRARAGIDGYLDAEHEAEEKHLTPAARLALTGPLLDDAALSLESLVARMVSRGRADAARAGAWNLRANALSTAVGVFALIGGAGVLVWVRTRVHRPLEALRNAIAGFAAGEHDRRAPVTGPTEVQEIALVFNRMSTDLEAQERRELQFLGGIAHDLREPLTGIRLALGLMDREPCPSQTRIHDTFTMVDKQANRMARIIGDFLDMTRIQSGHLELRAEPCDLGDLVREVADVYTSTSPGHSIAAVLPEHGVWSRCDSTRIAQVLNNLVSNAIKYSPQGGPVRIALTSDGDEAEIAVSDEGIGIPQAEIASIFEPFHRTAASRELAPGVGLGLSVSRRIVEAHGGRMEVESSLGRGTTFRVHLPRINAPAHPTPACAGADARSA